MNLLPAIITHHTSTPTINSLLAPIRILTCLRKSIHSIRYPQILSLVPSPRVPLTRTGSCTNCPAHPFPRLIPGHTINFISQATHLHPPADITVALTATKIYHLATVEMVAGGAVAVSAAVCPNTRIRWAPHQG